jgi:hypothetical protein
MMPKKLVVIVASLAILSALAMAGAGSTYKVDLYQATVVNGTTFKPGECKLELKENQVILKQGKTTAETTVRVENAGNKFNSTSVGYSEGNHIQEIRLGGTTTKLVFGGGEVTGADSAAR